MKFTEEKHEDLKMNLNFKIILFDKNKITF